MGIPQFLSDRPPCLGGALFIDVPNILPHDGEILSINWRALAARIVANEFQKIRILHVGAYGQNFRQEEMAARSLEEVIRQRPDSQTLCVKTTKENGKDIDGLIMNDMWEVTVRHRTRAPQLRTNPSQRFRMKYVLVSGDGGYLRALGIIQEAFDGQILPDVIVYSWRRKLSESLRKFALVRNVRYLDNMHIATKEARRALIST